MAAKPLRDPGTAWRYVSQHNDACGRGGSACVIVEAHTRGMYPYTIRFPDGKQLVAVERELQPLEESHASI